jgi:hypothetical protein
MITLKTVSTAAISLIGYTLLYILIRTALDPAVRAGKATGPIIFAVQLLSPWYWGVLIAVGATAVWYTSAH